MKSRGKLFIVSAPSGAGKSTLVEAVLGRLQRRHPIERVVTYTSRPMREGEEPGRDYFYISEEEFVKKKDEGFFLEWSNGLGHYYGTQKSILQALEVGKSGILVIDRIGATQIHRRVPGVLLIWIKITDIAVLEHRLLKRGTETKEQVQKRLIRAAQEIAEESEKKMYQFHIINDFFDTALKELEDVILAELASE